MALVNKTDKKGEMIKNGKNVLGFIVDFLHNFGIILGLVSRYAGHSILYFLYAF